MTARPKGLKSNRWQQFGRLYVFREPFEEAADGRAAAGQVKLGRGLTLKPCEMLEHPKAHFAT